MYIRDGIAYAGTERAELKVSGIRALPDHRLWVRFNTGEAKVFAFEGLLSKPAYAPLQDEDVFRAVYIDYGTPVWNDGEIDIAPEYLYENGISA